MADKKNSWDEPRRATFTYEEDIAFLRRAIELREEESGNQYKSMLKRALHYIDQNYTDENLSLNAVAKAANISPNYFSGVLYPMGRGCLRACGVLTDRAAIA